MNFCSWIDELKSNDICFDVGANDGKFTQKIINNNAFCVAIEPQPECTVKLNSQFSSYNRVFIEPVSIASSEDVSNLFVCNENSELSTTSLAFLRNSIFSRSRAFTWMEPIAIRSVTFDHLICKYGEPRLIKIDIEGGEAEALRGLSRPVDRIIFEFGDSMFENLLSSLKLLNSFNCYEFNFCRGEFIDTPHTAMKEWVGVNNLVDEIVTSNTNWGSVLVQRFS